ncbi:UNVERIFIED_CONTAM: putative protein ycf68 [Sesamum indicum]
MAYSLLFEPGGLETKPLLRRIDGADSGEIQCRSNFRFHSWDPGRSGGDHHGSSLLENPYIPYQCMDSYLSSTGLGSASMGKENGAPNNASSQTKNYEITPFILGISLILPSRKEEREILFPFRRDQEIGSSRKKNAWCDDLLHGRGLWFQVQDGPAAPGKRIEEASDYFMHAPLGSGDIAQLVELRSCNWVVAITGWMSNCPGSNDSILYLNRWLTFSNWSRRLSQGPSSEIPGEEDQVGPCEQLDALSPFNPLSEMRQKKRKENPWTDPIISTP